MTKPIDFPPALRRQVRDLIAIGGRITRDGITVVVDGPAEVADALRTETDQLAAHIVPSVTPDDAALVRNLLTDAGTSVAYVTDPAAAREAVADIRASQPEVIGLDVETEVLPAFRQPIGVAFNKDGKLAARQPRDGAAGAALDPYRSRARLVQAWAGGQHCLVFDMRTNSWNTPRLMPFSAVSCGSLSKPNCSTTLTSNARS
jgi:CheY-like chemotaxis protein